MPARTALLDTSAFKSLSGVSLATAREAGWQLTTSPWCFFELLCHLDEEDDFAKAKGNLMKLREVEIVDKPLDRAVAERVKSAEPRIWSSNLAYAALGAIDAANSLDDLAKSLIVDEAGNNRGPLNDAPDRLRDELDEEERKFRDLMASLIGVLRSEDAATRTAHRNHRVIMNNVKSGGVPLPDTPDLDYAAANEDQNLLD